MKEQLFARKTLAHYENDVKNSGLNRVLGKWQLTALGVGAVIGAGIFVMTGLAAKEYTGPALALSFIIAGTGCAFAALCYAEFASILPVEGSTYAYSYATVGELFAWIIGWDLILEYAMSSATVAVGWSGYLAKLLALFDVHFPIWLMNDLHTARFLIEDAGVKGTTAELSHYFSDVSIPMIGGFAFAVNLPAIVVVLIITAILVIGIKQTSGTNMVMVVIKVTVVLFIIGVGANYISHANWVPFIPERSLNHQGILSYGIPGIFTGAAYVFFAYIGFDAVSTQAGEAVNPQKSVPFGIIVSLVVCTILYILVSLVLTGMVKYTHLDITAPIAAAFANRGLHLVVWIVSLAAVAGLTSVLIVTLLAQSRLFYAMAKDRLLPRKIFGTLHARYRTPYKGTILTGLAVALVAGLFPIETIAKLVNIGTLFAFIMVCSAVWVLRVKEPHVRRPFKVPYLPVVACLGILFNLAMMLNLELENWIRLLVWLGLGLAIYFLYGFKKSNFSKKTLNNHRS